MMANNAQMENSPNPEISVSQRKRRGSGPENEETKCSRDSADLTMIDVSYAYLPTEILIKIFHYLDFYDVQAAKLCCSQWFKVSKLPEFNSKSVVKIMRCKFHSNHPAAEVISAGKIENLCLENIQLGDVDELFGQIGANLKTLTLKRVPIAPALCVTFTHFTNLQSLKVCNIRSRRLAEGVQTLKSGVLIQLKNLELIENGLDVDKYLLDCFLCADFLENLILTVTQELEIEVLKILDKQAEILKILDLRFYGRRTLAVSQWTRIASKLSLKELSLRNNFSRDIMVEMVKNQKSLRSLYLGNLCIPTVDDEFLVLIAQQLPQLERLFLVVCDRVTDIGVGQLAKLSKLTVLYLQRCNGITSDGIRNFIAQQTNIQLQELHMKVLRCLDEDVISFCAQNLPNLKVLDLCGCHTAVTDKSIMDVFKYQKNLRDLRLRYSRNLTDFGMLGSSSIRNIELLERLSLQDCDQLSDETLCGISAPHLKFLDLRGCLRMTSCGISTLVRNCPAIEEIAFTYSETMNEQVIDVLNKGLGRLRTLTISKCWDVAALRTTNWKQIRFPQFEGEVTFRRRT